MPESFNDLFDKESLLDSNDERSLPTQENYDSAGTASLVTSTQQDYCFCSNCGKKIKADSKFCRFCGYKIEEPELHSSSTTSDVVSRHEVSTSGKLEVKIANEPKVRKSTVANEIVANLKMLCMAFLLWGIYMIGFVCYHSKDIAPVTETSSYFGESCYDEGFISGSWEFSWEKHLAQNIAYMGKLTKMGIRETNYLGSSEYLFITNLSPERALEEAQRMARQKNIGQEEYNQIVERSKQQAKDDRDSFNQEISDRRKWAYEEDLHNHMLWSAIIALGLMIVGRYFIKACRWVAKNKT